VVGFLLGFPFGSSGAGIGGQIDGVKLDIAPLVKKEYGSPIKQLPSKEDFFPAMASRHFVVHRINGDGIVVGYATGQGHFKFLPQCLLAFVETKRFLIGTKAVIRRPFIETLMGMVVVLVFQVVSQAKLQGRAAGIDLKPFGKSAQNLGFCGPVEAFDFAMSLWIGFLSMDQVRSQLGNETNRIVGNESRSVVEIEYGHKAVLENQLIEATLKECCVFRGANDDMETESCGVVYKEQGHPASPVLTNSKVLSVAENRVHSVWKGETTCISVACSTSVGNR